MVIAAIAMIECKMLTEMMWGNDPNPMLAGTGYSFIEEAEEDFNLHVDLLYLRS